MKKYSKHIFIFCGLVFVSGAVLKLFPLSSFEFLLVKDGLSNWTLAPYFARAVILAELITGLHLLFESSLRKLSAQAAVTMLLVFTIYLINQFIARGNAANCGCFGEILPFSVLASILKNIFLMILLIAALTGSSKEESRHSSFHFALFALSFGLLLLFFPVKKYIVPGSEGTRVNIQSVTETGKSSAPKDTSSFVLTQPAKKAPVTEVLHKPLPAKANSVFTNYTLFSSSSVNLNEGEKVVAVLSLDCEHCLETLTKISALSKTFPLKNFYILFLGEQEQVQPFFSKAGGTFPFRILSPEEFFPLLTQSPPRIVYLLNGNNLGNWEGPSFDPNLFRSAVTGIRSLYGLK